MATGFRDIAARIRNAIERGDYPPGSRIPTEHELANQYGVSRETVRRALGLLKGEGLLESATSRGTRVPEPPVRLAIARYSAVLDPSRNLRDLGPWETACAEQGRAGRTEVVGVTTEPAEPELARRLDVPANTELVRRTRNMWADDQLGQIQDSWIPAELAKGTPMAGKGKVMGGIYAAMTDAGYIPTSVTEEITGRQPTPQERTRLHLGDGATVLEVWRTTRDHTGRVIEVLRTISNARRLTIVYENLPLRKPEG